MLHQSRVSSPNFAERFGVSRGVHDLIAVAALRDVHDQCAFSGGARRSSLSKYEAHEKLMFKGCGFSFSMFTCSGVTVGCCMLSRRVNNQ
jgi:hypothetical protein